MGEGTTGVGTDKTTRELCGEIAELREDLDVLVGELDRRRHEAVDVKLQVRRHAMGVALTGIAFVGTAAAFVWLGVWRHRRRQSLAARGSRLREAFGRMIDAPERVAAEPTVATRIATAAVNAAIAAVIKKILERAVVRALEHREEAAAPFSEEERTGISTAA